MSAAALAHMEQLLAYYHDPTAAPHDNPPRPPSHEVACELAASAARLAAIILDYQLTGELHADNPCPAAILAVSELMDKGNLDYRDALEVARRFGYEGD